jgi:hypothetical protein
MHDGDGIREGRDKQYPLRPPERRTARLYELLGEVTTQNGFPSTQCY